MATPKRGYHVAVVGCRDFTDYWYLKYKLDFIFQTHNTNKILSGGAQGTDSLACTYAQEHGYEFVEYPADWQQYGKKAGPIRNEQLVGDSDFVVAFWDGKSRGTKNSIDIAKRLNKRVYVIDIAL